MRNSLKRQMISLILALMSIFGMPAYAQTSAISDAKVSKLLKTCFSCHGPGGISKLSSRPSIAGQKTSYVARQLFAFQRTATDMKTMMDTAVSDEVAVPGGSPNMAQHLAKRRNPMMNHVLDGFDATLILRLSEAISRLSCRKDKPVSKPKFPVSSLPSMIDRCAACHGADGISTQSDTPNLAGQKRTYLRRELLLIRESAWGADVRKGETGRSHPIMERQVARLKITDVDALASYYSGLDCRGEAQK